ncbi:D-amino-acid oxidase [Aspergillus minisclerotigenes]|uniref:D-amino-acid oxidase n=1 Tax=Aspergillus minisclerotigenes TaxID=656917 RepID=A0A5N6IZ28_9EURO|nr:D-amino-acid oxidase [Aspergillus minisclerotigenes]
MSQKNVVVIGAGVAGLTTALLLSERSGYRIMVAAKHMPGDYDIEYASPWARANYMPVSIRGTRAAAWDQTTWARLLDLALNCPEAGIHLQQCEIYSRSKDKGSATAEWFSELLAPNSWFKDIIPNMRCNYARNCFRAIPESKLSPRVDCGTAFTSVCINTAIYLPWLVSVCLKNGVIFKRANFKHLGGPIDLIVNCTGLMASRIGGVEDKSVVPARGQIVVVHEEACYVMTRAAGGGTILGGSYQKGSWDSQVDPNLAVRIMKRAVELCPSLTGGKGIEHLDIIRHGVGLRPVREGGTRVEKERNGATWVVHNYGAGGAGYQSSYGCTQAAVDLVEEALRTNAKL